MLYEVFSKNRTQTPLLLAIVWLLAAVTKTWGSFAILQTDFSLILPYVLGALVTLVSVYVIRLMLSSYFPSINANLSAYFILLLSFQFFPVTLLFNAAISLLLFVVFLRMCIRWFFVEKVHFQVFNTSILIFLAAIVFPTSIFWYALMFFAILLFSQFKINYFIIVPIGFLMALLLQNTLLLALPENLQNLGFYISDFKQLILPRSGSNSWYVYLFLGFLMLASLFEWSKSVTRGNILKRKFMLLLGLALLFDTVFVGYRGQTSPLIFNSQLLIGISLSGFARYSKKKLYQEIFVWSFTFLCLILIYLS